MRALFLLLYTLGRTTTAHRADGEDVATSLRAAFWLLDRDENGGVDTTELSHGILSGAETWEAGLLPILAPHPFGEAQCRDPTLDAMSFVECIVHNARVAAAAATGPPTVVNFDAALASYIAGCAAPTSAWQSGDCLASCSECAALEAPQLNAAAGNSSVGLRVNSNSTGPTTTILVSSDWHVEPWWLAGGSCGVVCRFPKPTIANMFQCHDAHGTVGPCILATQGYYPGGKDPPIEFEQSHIASRAAARAQVHFFVGDTQAHSFTGSSFSQPAAITKLLGRVLTEEVARFKSGDNIVWTMGNNDGPHNSIFTETLGYSPSTLGLCLQSRTTA